MKDTEPLCCSFCKCTDGGPFAEVTNMAPEGKPNPLICKRCCDEQGIEVEWGPAFVGTTTVNNDKKLIEEAERVAAGAPLFGVMLTKLAARLKELAEPKLPEPLVDGFYWVCWNGKARIAERQTTFGFVEWTVQGFKLPFKDTEIEPLSGPLLPPNVTK